MTEKYPRYLAYKPSGTEFLGMIPDSWKILRGKFVFSEWCELSANGDEALLSVSEYYGVKPRGDVVDEGEFLSRAESLVGYKKCQKKDLVMNIMLAWKRGLGVSKYDGIVSPAYSVFRFNRNASPDYMHYLLRTDIYTDHFKTRSTGVMDSRLRLYPESFADVSILLPSLAEQNSIVRFLEYETSIIDELIEKQKRLVKLLNEKRQAIICHAITKGISSNIPMKDSGVRWLGKIPAHWDMVPLKYLCNFSGGGTPSKENLNYWIDGDIPWVSPKDMKNFWITDSQDKITELAVRESSANYVEPEALLIVVRSGILQRMIPIAINKVRVTLNQDMKALRFNQKMNVEFVANFILGNQSSLLFEWLKEGATVESIDQAYLAGSAVPVPPIEEQEKINKFLDKKMVVFQKLEQNAIKGIGLLNERRAALISAAVTGKIDVRNWQPPKQKVADPQNNKEVTA